VSRPRTIGARAPRAERAPRTITSSTFSFAHRAAFDDYEGCARRQDKVILCPYERNAPDAALQRRTSTIVRIAAQNYFNKCEPMHPAQSLGSPPCEGDLSIWGPGPLPG
jgi:hypothetical protein